MASTFVVIQALILLIVFPILRGLDGGMSEAQKTKDSLITNSYALVSMVLALRLGYIGRFYKKFTMGRYALYLMLSPAILVLAALIANIFSLTIPESVISNLLYIGPLLGIFLAIIVVIENLIHPIARQGEKKQRKSAIITPDYAEDFPKD